MGIIFDIKRFAERDGPGIRTTVFLKGCPLSCLWCHNPESQSFERELIIHRKRCVLCEECIKNCKMKALKNEFNKIVLMKNRCDYCEKCAQMCVKKALEFVGREIEAKDVITECEKDIMFYEESGGGITLSGGEPLSQIEFTEELLKGFKEKGIHTAIDTCGYAPFSYFERILPVADMFLYDIKLVNNKIHRQVTGKSNELILNNLRMLAEKKVRTIVRIPIIPGVNDNYARINEMIDFLKELPLLEIDLIHFHKYGFHKYEGLGLNNPMQETESIEMKQINWIYNLFQTNGFKTRNGG